MKTTNPKKPRRHVSEVIRAYCKTKTLKSFEEVAEVSHAFAIYLRDKGSLEVGRAGDVFAALRQNGEARLADDFLLAYLRDHIPNGTETRVEVSLKKETVRTPKSPKTKAVLEWLADTIDTDPAINDLVSAAYELAQRTR